VEEMAMADAGGGCPIRVGIIGAGPAGTFFALHLFRLSEGSAKQYEVTLFDRKVFDMVGPRGCNMCAGAIGFVTYQKIKELRLELEESVIRSIVDGYIIHGKKRMARIVHPSKKGIYTVFRGGGPVVTVNPRWKSFDQFLLDQCVERGMVFINRRVTKVEESFSASGKLYSLTVEGMGTMEFDLLVGAFGVNSPLSKNFIPGYVPPKTWHTCQAELQSEDETFQEPLRKMINIFSGSDRKIRFIAITPKDEYLTLTAIGEHVKIGDLRREIETNERLKNFLPPKHTLICHCHPQVPVSIAQKPVNDSVAVVGDAFVSRFLKNGIDSAYETARILAETVHNHGQGVDVLREHYVEKCFNIYHLDNRWGKTLFQIYEKILRKGFLADLYISCVEREGADASDQNARLTRVLWGVFAGDRPYKEIFREACTIKTFVSLARHILSP